jgi:uncharacterized protein (TIGR03437 family)
MPAAFCQRPVITPEGLVNSASFHFDPKRGAVFAPGRLFTIFGQNLSVATEQASSVPLPRTLGGTSVMVDGLAVPLFYVSPNQINFQVPYGIASTRPVDVIVHTARGPSNAIKVNRARYGPGLFTQSGGACGQGAILNNFNSATTLNTPENSAAPGDVITVFGTGFGGPENPPPDGVPSGFPKYTDSVGRFFGRVMATGPFAGLAPSLIGVDQFNVIVPDDAPEGCQVPFYINSAGMLSQPVSVSIRKGRGRCQDPPMSTAASLVWSRITTTGTGPEPNTSNVEEVISASFRQGGDSWIRPVDRRAGLYWASSGFSTNVKPSCGRYTGDNVDAGNLLVKAGSKPLPDLVPTVYK